MTKKEFKEIKDCIEVLRKPRGMVSFLEEAEVGSLLVDIEMKKRGGGKVRDKGAQVSQRTEGCGWAPTHVGAPAELCQ